MHFEYQCNLGITIVEHEWNCGISEEERDQLHMTAFICRQVGDDKGFKIPLLSKSEHSSKLQKVKLLISLTSQASEAIVVVATATLPRNDTLQLPRHLGNLCHCGTLSPLFSFPTNLCYLCSFIQAVLSSWTTDTTSVADTFSAPRTSVRISLELLPDDGNRRNP